MRIMKESHSLSLSELWTLCRELLLKITFLYSETMNEVLKYIVDRRKHVFEVENTIALKSFLKSLISPTVFPIRQTPD